MSNREIKSAFEGMAEAPEQSVANPNDAKAFNKVGVAVAKGFESTYMNLLSCFDTKSLYDAIGAELRVEGLDEVTRNNLTYINLFRATEQAFLRLLYRGALRTCQRFVPGSKSDAGNELREMERRCGIVHEAEPEQATQAPGGVSEAEALDAQVIDDWRNLPAGSVRSKRNADAAYARAFDRMMTEGKLNSFATSHVVASEDRRPEP